MFSRSQSFNQGTGGSPVVVTPPASFANEQERQNMMTPRVFTASSPLHQLMPSGNGIGLDPSDQDRRLLGGAMLPSANGSSASSYAAKRPFLNPTMGISG
jgi:hypothetical protein